MNKDLANKILIETEIGYNQMAKKFSETRKFFWRGMEFIGDYVKDGDRVLDYGSGNGRLLELFQDKKIEYFGVDPSQKLVDIASQKYSQGKFIKLNPLQNTLAFNTENFNTIYSIAVFHHFPSGEYRKKVAEELYRVCQKDGQIIITVWNLFQRRYIKNIVDNWIDKLLNKNKLDWNDCYISFTDNAGNKFLRFHHAFTKRELKKLFEETGFETQMCKIINGRNIVYIGKK